MAVFLYLAFLDAAEGADDEFNRWYDEQHLADVLDVEGFVAARRFRLAQDGPSPLTRYLALYEVESDDIEATSRELAARVGTSVMPMSSAIDATAAVGAFYEALGERVAADPAERQT